MDASVLLSLLVITITLLFLAVGCASVFWIRASRSTRRQKSPPSCETPSSEAALAQVRADQAELFSTLEKLTTTVKRLSSRQGMRELREAPPLRDDPPQGTSKADLLRHYGMSGKVGPAFAQAQLDLERNKRANS